ncbi:MAG: PHP domain-containing protein [Clostridia bacterium]|nr:PHP domain-containing protein [Clostridia bacterium]
MIQDLHSHSYYSFCGKDNPEELVKAAINGGIEVFGITDHNNGIGFGRRDARAASEDIIPNQYDEYILHRYFDHLTLLKEKYSDKIDLKRGIEVATNRNNIRIPKTTLPDSADISFFDYCLIEHLDYESTTTNGDIFSYAKRCGTEYVGIAHTNLFAFIESKGLDPLDYFKKMADQNIFWEMNVSYDSTHHYREHKYMLDFFENEKQQEIVRKSGVRLSIGFDGHRVEDYLPDRIKTYCKRITDCGIKMVFEN